MTMRWTLLSFLLLSLPLHPSFALDLSPFWSSDFRKYVAVTCEPKEESFCLALCGAKDHCALREGYCRDCAGTSSLYLKDIFDTLGDAYVNLQQAVPIDDVLAYLREGAFVSLTSDSVYNFVTAFDSDEIRGRFRQLCNDPTDRPVLMASVDPKTREFRQLDFVLCQDRSHELVAFRVGRNRDVVIAPPVKIF